MPMDLPPLWLLALGLFLLPLLAVAVGYRVFKRGHGLRQGGVLAWLVTVCWISALLVIWVQVR